MENQKQRKSVGTIVLVVLLLIVTVLSLVLATYAWARYTTVEHNNATATVAKWDVSFTPGTTVFTKSYDHVVSQRLAPGTSGEFVMEINSNETDVSYEYRIMMKELKNKPTNLHFFADSAYTEEITFYNNPTISDPMTKVFATRADRSTSSLYGRVLIKGDPKKAAQANYDLKKTIYWKWDYQTADIYKDEDGKEALPADIDTPVSYTDTTNTKDAKTAQTTTKRKRIVHDIKEYMRSRGIADTAYTLADTADLAAMQGLAKEYTVTDTTISGNGSESSTRTEEVTKEQIDQVINDAIDTVDGLAARTMSFNVEYTAIQCQTTGTDAGKTADFKDYIDYTLPANN